MDFLKDLCITSMAGPGLVSCGWESGKSSPCCTIYFCLFYIKQMVFCSYRGRQHSAAKLVCTFVCQTLCASGSMPRTGYHASTWYFSVCAWKLYNKCTLYPQNDGMKHHSDYLYLEFLLYQSFVMPILCQIDLSKIFSEYTSWKRNILWAMPGRRFHDWSK